VSSIDHPAGVDFKACGLITLTTDFGLKDPFVGVMKGQVLGRLPDAQIVDITHEIVAHWPAEAGFWLARSYGYFPAGTVHVAVVDPGVGGDRDIAAVEVGGHLFLAPDNGLLASVVARADTAILRRVAAGTLVAMGIHAASATFHGRDIFAPLAAELAAGRLPPGELGECVDELVPGWLDEPAVTPGRVAGAVVTVDHFGNLITNIEAGQISKLIQPTVRAGGRDLPLRRTYSDVRPGDCLALVNSFGVLELACAQRSAAESLGLDRGAPVVVSSKAL
jgi:hypothetical protein